MPVAWIIGPRASVAQTPSPKQVGTWNSPIIRTESMRRCRTLQNVFSVSLLFMRPTLFLIPHEVFGLPIFGFGWLLAAFVLGIVVRLAWAARTSDREEGAPSPLAIVRDLAPIWGVAGIAIALVLPKLELTGPTGQPVGIAVRGYGVFLMLAAVSSVAAAAYRAQRKGIHLTESRGDRGGSAKRRPKPSAASLGLSAESILQLAPWTFTSGIVGARLFYVAQYYRDFLRPTWWETIGSMAALTQGGLVVYGGLIGGGLVSAWYVWRRGWNVWQLGDVIVPCIFIGLMFGRLGCLMNGCCYGGACQPGWFASTFPAGSPVYRRQLLDGELVGLSGVETVPTDPNQRSSQRQLRVTAVSPNSLSAQAGVQPGDEITLYLDTDLSAGRVDRPATEVLPTLVMIRDGRLIAEFSPDRLPRRAAPVRATQAISASLAAIMFLLLLGVERYLRAFGGRLHQPGVLLCIGCVAYAVLRMVLEWVRVDEAGQFGTGLSISQIVSLLIIGIGVLTLWIRLARFGPVTPSTASAEPS